ncbi:MAG: asparaginase domain-containing protein [Gammaproteobacteria bacterium]|nr:asparaginase domain-containing protein [Gammaproteobacteria bacterium]
MKNSMTLRIITTGGTIDKVYFDDASEFQVGEPQIAQVLHEARAGIEFVIQTLMRKDSLDMDDGDRAEIARAVADAPEKRVIVTHGTDTMIESACRVDPPADKTIVFTGAMQPVRFQSTDAVFNIGMAVAAVQTLAPGVYLAISGRIFDPRRARKNRDAGRFEEIPGS